MVNNEEKKYLSNDEIEIDLGAFLMRLKSLWYVVVICMLIGILVVSIYISFFKVPYYESSSMVYIRNSTKEISLQDLQLSSELANDYEIIFKSRPNLEKVITKLNLDMNVKSLSNMISITNPVDTRILQVSVTSQDPNLSKEIANEVVRYGMDSIREIDSQEPYLIEEAIAKNEKVGYSSSKMILIGSLMGMLISSGLIFIQFVLSDEIRGEEDLESNFDIPVLAIIPESQVLSYKKNDIKQNSIKEKVEQWLKELKKIIN